MKLFLIFLTALVFIALFGNKNKSSEYDDKLIEKVTLASQNIDADFTLNKNQAGTIKFNNDGKTLEESQIQSYIKREKSKESYSLIWFDSDKNSASMSAFGLDRKHHFVNSYLVGIRPFPVKNIWLPLYALSKVKKYELDSKQYYSPEMWQNSAQAMQLTRGDCEDHALALADWLISEGVDAKVVLGKYKKSGHAWVIAQHEGKTYLLEATDKRVSKSWNHYPLASLAVNYHPKYMFNRTSFWENTGTTMTTNYTDEKWVTRSTFHQTR